MRKGSATSKEFGFDKTKRSKNAWKDFVSSTNMKPILKCLRLQLLQEQLLRCATIAAEKRMAGKHSVKDADSVSAAPAYNSAQAVK